MQQQHYLRLSPAGFALGAAAAAFVTIVLRLLTFGFGYGMMRNGPYAHGPYGEGIGMMSGGYLGFGLIAAAGAIVFAALIGALFAVTYNAAASRTQGKPNS